MIIKFHYDDPDYAPVYATAGAAGMDVRSTEDHYLLPGQVQLVDTGLSCEIPEGFELQVRPRSGLAVKHGVTVLNSPGTIDSDYTGPIKVILINHGQYPFTINRGDRIAQLVASKVFRALATTPMTERGANGFGSTGR